MSNTTKNYENAAKDIEQEKKVVAALKRLSIGNMMNYDPDLPVDEAEFQFNEDLQSGLLQRSDQVDRLSRENSVNSHSSADTKHSDTHSQSDSVFFDAENDDSILDTSTDSLLWVPANLHPEVDPEQFKLHVKTKVEEMLERKSSRKKTLSRRSSLSTHSHTSSPELKSPEGRASLPVSPQDKENSLNIPRNRYSNPSLRDLTNELEKLSNMAGMNANDAVTLARSLSSTSLGFTDVERQAFDEIKSPPHISPTASLRQSSSDSLELPSEPESPTPNHSQKIESPMQMDNSIPEFALRRSRRLDYRKNSTSGLMSGNFLGSNLQNTKHDKLVELRNNLNHTPVHEAPAPISKVPKKRNARNVRDSQMMFSYRNPNENTSSGSLSSTGGSPYHSSSSILMDPNHVLPNINNHKLQTRDSRNLYPSDNVNGMRHQIHQSHKSNHKLDNIYMQQLPSQRPPKGTRKHHHYQREMSNNSPGRQHHINQRNYNMQDSHIVNGHTGYNNRGVHNVQNMHLNIANNAQQPQYQHQRVNYKNQNMYNNAYPVFNSGNFADGNKRSYISQEGANKQNEMVDLPSSVDKSSQLSQNLDLLRSEIHEFKEILSNKSDESKNIPEVIYDKKPNSNNNTIDLDISFENSYQDLSYEDSLGLDKESSKPLSKDTEFEVNTQNILNNDVFVDDTGTTTEKEASKPGDMAHSIDLSPEFKEIDDNIDESPEIDEKDQKFQKDTNKTGADSNDKSSENKHPRINTFKELPKIERTNTKSDGEYSDQSSTEISPKKRGKKDFGKLKNMNPIPPTNGKKGLKKKKSWQWLRERSSSLSSVDSGSLPSVREDKPTSPIRSVSLPEVSHSGVEESKERASKHSEGKENMITKLFRKKKTQPKATEEKPTEKDVHKDTESSKKQLKKKKKASMIFKPHAKSSSIEDKKEEKESPEEHGKEHSHGTKIEGNLTSMEVHSDNSSNELQDSDSADSISHDEVDIAESPQLDDHSLNIQDSESKRAHQSVSEATLEVQEKLRKSIKRTSKANQPIEFTDSAFGFPLPPPSTSTLIMLEYRFPVHVERAIYRLSHLKLANPKRSLKEQVLLSNFMYAYLNLVDHTLHLEQRQNTEDQESAKGLTTEESQDLDQGFDSEEFVPVIDDDKLQESSTEEIIIELDTSSMSNAIET